MKKVTLKIKSLYDTETVTLEDEISIGRTPLADIVLKDEGLSRVNTTIFRDGDEILVVDEGSTNGTFINGSKVGKSPKILFDGDVITCGSETKISIEFGEKSVLDQEIIEEESHTKKSGNIVGDASIRPTVQKYKSDINVSRNTEEKPWILWVAAGSTALILFLAIVGIIIAKYFENGAKGRRAGNGKTTVANPNKAIPIFVVDPLGGQKQEDLDELVQYWEVQEKEVEAEDLADITASSDSGETKAAEGLDYKVSVEYWKKQRAIALAGRNSPTGNNPPGTQVPRELGGGIFKQKAKILEMISEGYQQPMDFADLAKKRMSGELVELPMATEYWVLEVGGSSTKEQFTSFNFGEDIKTPTIQPGSQDYIVLSQLANNFSGEKYDLNNPDHRRQMKIRLLRMFHPSARPVLEKLAKSYYAKFQRPLRITSLSRSMQYQMSLNKSNPNSFKVRGEGSLPPHTSGCTFDLARKHMTAEEQNFVMEQLAEMEREGILDALREGNLNACFHVFIYDDGKPPKM